VAGYSGTPLPKKLGIKDGSAVSLVGAPPGFAHTELAELPPGAHFVGDGVAPIDVIVVFAEWMAALEEQFVAQTTRLQPAGGLWVAWPKRASGRPTDLSENLIRDIGLAAGLVDNKVCAIDGTWSGLRFVYRLRTGAASRHAAGVQSGCDEHSRSPASESINPSSGDSASHPWNCLARRHAVLPVLGAMSTSLPLSVVPRSASLWVSS
jgi:hypothetical protein